MAKFKSDFLNVLDERGFLHQCSDFAGLDALAAKGQAVGYDCTGPSLHKDVAGKNQMADLPRGRSRRRDRALANRKSAC